RFSRDWSSDVCSSDLANDQMAPQMVSSRKRVMTMPLFVDLAIPFTVSNEEFWSASAKALAGNARHAPILREQHMLLVALTQQERSDERRVGKACRTRK